MTATPSATPILKRAERRRWLVFSVAMLFVLYLAWLAVAQSQTASKANSTAQANKALADCTANWAQTTSDRSTIVARYNQQSNTAFSIYTSIPAGQVVKKASALAVYHLAQAALTRQLALHPPPTYTCNKKNAPSAKPFLPTAFPTPVIPVITATKTATAPGATSTSILTVPGSTSTRVVPMPGRTVTVTRHRTVTRTVSPPSCLTHPIPPCVLIIPK